MIEVADDLAALGCKMVDLSGGEPLLHPRWHELASALVARGMRVSLITNGTLLDDRNLARAVKSGIEVVGISLDGLREVHDATRIRPKGGPSPWGETVAAIERAVKCLTTKVITQVNQENLHQLGELRALLKALGVRHWQLQLAVPTGRLMTLKRPYVIHPEDLTPLTDFMVAAIDEGEPPFIDTSDNIGYYTEKERLLRKRTTGQGVWLGCQAGLRAVAITYNGRVRGCSLLPEAFDAGTLHEESLREIWRDEARFPFSTGFKPERLTGYCRTCAFGALCRAGCTGMAYHLTGTIYENPYCLTRLAGKAAETAHPPDTLREAGT
jgi:radical SAM protein with 4Fe4S-binding SPASM domain